MTESDDNELRLAQARPRQRAPQPDPPDLSRDGMNAVSLYAIGTASEGGRNPYALAFAGEQRNGLLYPVEKSGITIGTMQTDLGQRPEVATELVNGQGDPTTAHYRRVAVDVSEALNTPVEQSSEVARSATQTREQVQAQQLAQAQTLNQDEPSGPTMRIGARGAGGSDIG